MIMYLLTCHNEVCRKSFHSKNKRQKFCSQSCATIQTNKIRGAMSEESRKNISNGVRNYLKLHPEKIRCGPRHSQSVGMSTRGKYKGESIQSILDVSSRTASKILKRLELGCCVCGWKEENCDIHHINGRKIENANQHDNLTYLCPNHHRLADRKKLDKEKMISLDKFIPENWKDFYFG